MSLIPFQNHLYYVGLRAAIAKKRSEGQEVHVLDIGTGTGLLAMMAARIGAESVTAIEVRGQFHQHFYTLRFQNQKKTVKSLASFLHF